MKKLLYSTEDLIEEFELAGYMKGLELVQIKKTIPLIEEEQYNLYAESKYDGWKFHYVCEWIEDGLLQSDDWVLHPDKFVCGIVREYIVQAKKIPY